MKKKYTINEVVEKIDRLKSLKHCDRFESNMLSLGYVEDELISCLKRKRIHLRKSELEEKLLLEKSEEVSEKLIDDFLNALGAYEEFLSTKNSKKTIAQRLRQNIKKIGLRDALITATSKKTLTDGYKYLIDQGLEEYTLEKVILNNKELFDEDLVVFIKDKINSN